MSSSRQTVAGFACAALVLAVACSSSSEQPATGCPPGYSADPQGRCCTADGRCIDAAVCGPNTSRSSAGGCTCEAPFKDCNGNIGLDGGDGCECSGECDGVQCAGCIPTVAHACGSWTSYCETSSLMCASCPEGRYDCDGLGVNSCESDDSSCGKVGGECSPETAHDCPAFEQYCDAALLVCKPCPTGMHNCDGTGPCETTASCGAEGCDAQCQQESEIYCVRDPARNNLCTPCLDDAHCRANPRSRGPICDEAQNLCTCTGPQDCAGDSSGAICKQAGSVMSCGCNDDGDCTVTPYTKCSPTVFGKCIEPCTSKQDCPDPATQDCDLASGECYDIGP